MSRVCVVGGGISGLCAAFRLQQAGADVVLYEKGTSAGGTIRTDVSDGFLVENGPNSTLTSVELLDLIKDLELESEIAIPSPNARKRFIVRDAKLVPLPAGPFDLFATSAFSGSAKMRLFKEPFVNTKAAETESVGEFFERRVGREIVDYAVDPFISGIYAGDPRKLSIKHAFPRLFKIEEESGSLLKGMLFPRSKRPPKPPKGTPRSLTFKKGMQTLVDKLSAVLGERIKLETRVQEIAAAQNGGYSIRTDKGDAVFDGIVLCAPASAVAQLVRPLGAHLAEELSGIYYPPVSVVYTGFKAEDVKFNAAGFGFLVPGCERRKILGSLWTSSVFEGRAPAGYHLYTTFIGGSRNPELARQAEDKLTRTALEELGPLLGLVGEPVFTGVKKWDRAIPQYNVGYGSVVEAIDSFRKDHPGIHFCSNFYRGISVSDCVKNAAVTAAAVSGNAVLTL